MERTQLWIPLSPLPPEFNVGILGPGGVSFSGTSVPTLNSAVGGGNPNAKQVNICKKPNRKSTLIIYSMYGKDVLVRWMPKAPPVHDDHGNARPRQKKPSSPRNKHQAVQRTTQRTSTAKHSSTQAIQTQLTYIHTYIHACTHT